VTVSMGGRPMRSLTCSVRVTGYSRLLCARRGLGLVKAGAQEVGGVESLRGGRQKSRARYRPMEKEHGTVPAAWSSKLCDPRTSTAPVVRGPLACVRL